MGRKKNSKRKIEKIALDTKLRKNGSKCQNNGSICLNYDWNGESNM